LLAGQTLSFQTAPVTASETPFTFVAIGDYGRSGNEPVRDQLLLDSFQFIVTTGDNAYNNGRYNEFDTRVFQVYGDIFSQVGLYPTLGDHDYGSDEGAPYLDLFDLPDQAWRAADKERYYSFDYGNAHFVALDSIGPLGEDDQDASDDMFDWLRDDLSQTNQVWKIVFFQAPAYTGFSQTSQVRQKLTPIFEEYGVDLVLTGHSHLYERSWPMLDDEIVIEGGIIYLITGAGWQSTFDCTNGSWVAYSYCGDDNNLGMYARISVNGNSLTIDGIDQNGTLRDSITISKDTGPNLFLPVILNQ